MGSGVKRSSTSSGITECLCDWAILFRFKLQQLREGEFGFEACLWVQLSDFLLSSTCLLLLRVLTGSPGLLQWIWLDWCLPNRTWGELLVSFLRDSGDKVLDLIFLFSSHFFFKLHSPGYEGDLNFTIWFSQEFRRACFAPIGGRIFRQFLGESDAQDEFVGLNVDDSSTHVDWSNGSVHRWLSVVLGDGSKTGQCLDDSTWEVLSEVPTVGFAVCALPEFAPLTQSFLAMSSESSKSLRLFWDEQFKSTTGNRKRYKIIDFILQIFSVY